MAVVLGVRDVGLDLLVGEGSCMSSSGEPSSSSRTSCWVWLTMDPVVGSIQMYLSWVDAVDVLDDLGRLPLDGHVVPVGLETLDGLGAVVRGIDSLAHHAVPVRVGFFSVSNGHLLTSPSARRSSVRMEVVRAGVARSVAKIRCSR